MRKLIFVLGIGISFNAYGDCDETGYFDCGMTGDVKWYLSSDKKTLRFVGNGAMDDYVADNNMDGHRGSTAPWAKYYENIQTIDISAGVENVGNRAFRGLSAVENVNIADTVTKIGIGGFANNVNLRTIKLPNSIKEIGYSGFDGCLNLSEINMPDSLEYLGNSAFSGCNLTSIVLPSSLFYPTSMIYDPLNNALNGSYISTVYCAEDVKECLDYDFEHRVLTFDPETMIATYEDSNIIPSKLTYKKETDGRYVLDGTRYKSFEDMSNGTNGVNLKRIYTIDEANQVAGEKNRVSIKYR